MDRALYRKPFSSLSARGGVHRHQVAQLPLGIRLVGVAVAGEVDEQPRVLLLALVEHELLDGPVQLVASGVHQLGDGEALLLQHLHHGVHVALDAGKPGPTVAVVGLADDQGMALAIELHRA